MMDVVNMFQERDTRDELGIGTIRDAFSDYLFPGTSTIQTRARYMLFIPWIYTEIEHKKVKSNEVAYRARKNETKLIYSLLNSESEEGIIGKREKENLKRMPSNIYWNGLGSWGIRKFMGTQEQYYRSLDTYYRNRKLAIINDDKEPVNGLFNANWDPQLPRSPDDFLKRVDMNLTFEEACYLKDRIQLCHQDCLLSFLLNVDEEMDANFFWDLPFIDNFSTKLKENINHARNFSETIHGAALLYNLMLSKESGNEILVKEYENKLDSWIDKIDQRWDLLINWYNNRSSFWSSDALKYVNIPPLTHRFVDEWFRIIFINGNINDVIQNDKAQLLIRDREVRLKGKRARLKDRRSLENWNGHSGDVQLDFRWNKVRTIINDVIEGLNEKKGDFNA